MVSAAFELALRGMLSNETRWMKTAIVIDELGAMNRLGSLNRLTAGGWIFRHGYSKTENLRETHLVLPSELQALPKREGYLTIADGTPPARVKIEPKGYLQQAERFVSKH